MKRGCYNCRNAMPSYGLCLICGLPSLTKDETYDNFTCDYWKAELTDREKLEQLVRICLADENPNISIGKGKELLGFTTMNEMRDWLNGKEKDAKIKPYSCYCEMIKGCFNCHKINSDFCKQDGICKFWGIKK